MSRSSLADPAVAVAPKLLGCLLVRDDGGERLAGRIVETEAYEFDDEASHAFRGKTPRNASMFAREGTLYVYFTYGMHFCCNVVTGGEGVGSAVLLRALEPVEGLTVMAMRRGRAGARDLCSGPAKLCQAFGLTREHDGQDLCGRDSPIRLERGPAPGSIGTSARIGISAGTDRPWRFFDEESAYLSRPAARFR